MSEWAVVDGRPRPVSGAAVWHLPGGDCCHGEMRLVQLDLDLPPGS